VFWAASAPATGWTQGIGCRAGGPAASMLVTCARSLLPWSYTDLRPTRAATLSVRTWRTERQRSGQVARERMLAAGSVRPEAKTDVRDRQHLAGSRYQRPSAPVGRCERRVSDQTIEAGKAGSRPQAASHLKHVGTRKQSVASGLRAREEL